MDNFEKSAFEFNRIEKLYLNINWKFLIKQ